MLAVDAGLVTIFVLGMFVEALYKLNTLLNELIPGRVAYPSLGNHLCDFALAAFLEHLFCRIEGFDSLVHRLEKILDSVPKMPFVPIRFAETRKNSLEWRIEQYADF